MIKFGPSGCGEQFYNEGNKSTVQMPKWLSDNGLNLFEYSFGRGVNIGEQKAREVGEECVKNNIEISVHAPYYINFASNEAEKNILNAQYMMTSMEALRWLGGKRCIFHIGSPKKLDRRDAMDKLQYNIKMFIEQIYANNMNDIIICPETMGKINQLGTVEEIIEVCKLDKIFTPCIDLGHVNSREGGTLKNKNDFKAVFSKFIDELSFDRVCNLHIHFSHIEYTQKGGEVRHLTNADTIFGPFFEPCAEAIMELGLAPHIISESAGTQDIDSIENKEIYNMVKGRFKV